MAIYHLSGQIISRTTKDGRSRSTVACAAYRSGEKLYDERSMETKSYNRKVEPVTKIIAPDNAPEWVYNRENLWNEVEKIEKQYNSQLAREFNIALPIELDKEEQEKLAFEFCQKAFVDRGMVADISIHRDHIENPHFHVMLTMRPFKENGEWGAKSRKEYVLDEDGNKIKLPSGNYKSIKVSTTDWDKEERMNEWRKLWEVMTNTSLKRNGIEQTISCESNKSIGKEEIATIHEGYVARKIEKNGKVSERVEQNKLIKEYNDTVIELAKYRKLREEKEKNNNFKRSLSPKEKIELKNIARELKLYVNVENINSRLKQLNWWRKSLEYKNDSLDKSKKITRINKEEKLLNSALNILENESNRFIQKNYIELNIKDLTKDEKLVIVERTITKNRELTIDEINKIKADIQEVKLKEQPKELSRNKTEHLSAYQEWSHKNNKFSYKEFIREAIQISVAEQSVNNIDDLALHLKNKYNIQMDYLDIYNKPLKKVKFIVLDTNQKNKIGSTALDKNNKDKYEYIGLQKRCIKNKDIRFTNELSTNLKSIQKYLISNERHDKWGLDKGIDVILRRNLKSENDIKFAKQDLGSKIDFNNNRIKLLDKNMKDIESLYNELVQYTKEYKRVKNEVDDLKGISALLNKGKLEKEMNQYRDKIQELKQNELYSDEKKYSELMDEITNEKTELIEEVRQSDSDIEVLSQLEYIVTHKNRILGINMDEIEKKEVDIDNEIDNIS